ncbi:hypothetical protein K469DRAFT_755657 [Zopfia rhizophila CBS 207.26]|uniref:Uncharacterized protein n=1 Tax=Zopfia rhizophila CBS 207.26 TaxID=1314779 RepID=A0A6A6DEM7_9PEZI|nr:hypothetical protein K469DRAFT_755657 [Zopfia rhizophila CBS 207.26]
MEGVQVESAVRVHNGEAQDRHTNERKHDGSKENESNCDDNKKIGHANGNPKGNINENRTVQDGHLKAIPAYRSIQERFYRSLIAVIFGSIVSLLVTSFVTILWYSAQSNMSWREIVLRNWFTRAVTLAALVGVAVSIQASIAASKMASLLIEGARCPIG